MILDIKSQNRQTAVNLLTAFLTTFVQFAIRFFLSPYIVGTMGEEANGYTQLANNFVTYASLLTLAFNSMAGRFISVEYNGGREDKAKMFYSSAMLSNIIITLCLVPAAVWIIGRLEHIIVIEGVAVADVKWLFCFVFANFFFQLLLSISQTALFITNRIYIGNIFGLVSNVLNAALLLVIFLVLPARIYYVSLVALGLTLLSVPAYLYCKKKYAPTLRFDVRNFQISAVITMFKSGIWNTVNQCGNILMTGLDLLICNLFISPAAMGVLSVANTFPTVITSIATTINNSFSPVVTISWARGSREELLGQLRNSMKISSVLLSCIIVVFCVFAVPFYRLWMPTMDEKELALLSFLACMQFIPWTGPQTLYNVFTAADKLKANSIVFMLSGVLNIVVVYFLLRFTNLGIIAVAGTSSAIRIVRSLCFTAPYTARILGMKWHVFYRDVGISLICCGVSFVSATAARMLVHIQGWAGLIFAVVLGCIGALILNSLVVLGKEDRRMLYTWYKKRIKRQ